MKLLIVSLVAAASAIAIAQPASAQISKRERTISMCIAKAHREVPVVEDSTDSNTTARVNIYKSCMKSAGMNP
jgi:hypothetical protein